MSNLMIDLSDLEIEDVELLAIEGRRGMPDFAASCCSGCTCNSGGCSCTQDQQQQQTTRES